MPELPEVESARAVIERSALRRRIQDVDDTDSYVCRPHPAGQLRDALVGHQLRAAHRRGKSIWCEVTGDGPVLATRACIESPHPGFTVVGPSRP